MTARIIRSYRYGGFYILQSLAQSCKTENGMSIDIDWRTLTTGPDGLALAESIKDFIHEKFQQVELPRFVRSVQVHTFEFGKECPVVELRDICDPLAEFYETDDNEEHDEEEVRDSRSRPEREDLMHPPKDHSTTNNNTAFSYNLPSSSSILRPSFIDTRHAGLRSNLGFTDHVTPFLSRSNTPGIPGGTSNLSYFHLPLGAGLSGSQTPLAAVAGGTPFSPGWDHHGFPAASQQRGDHPSRHESSYSDPSSRPSTAESYQEMKKHTGNQDPPEESESTSTARKTMPDPMDTQVVLHISYQGTIRLSITAEILLDYPMPSFVGIPLKLNITGLSFDGVALIAYLRKRAHFCFLTPDDAQTIAGVNSHNHEAGTGSTARREDSSGGKLGGLLREIRVESEIGRKEEGKQVLKNVGKVEKFVLDQVRRIFQDEFVWPSSWTFLV